MGQAHAEIQQAVLQHVKGSKISSLLPFIITEIIPASAFKLDMGPKREPTSIDMAEALAYAHSNMDHRIYTRAYLMFAAAATGHLEAYKELEKNPVGTKADDLDLSDENIRLLQNVLLPFLTSYGHGNDRKEYIEEVLYNECAHFRGCISPSKF